MSDSLLQLKIGEKRPFYGSAATSSGTLTITGTPTLTVKDSTGTDVTGLVAINVTGSDAGALATVRAWYNLDSTAPAVLAAGFYTLVFSIACTGSDGLTRIYEPSITIQVLAVTS